MNSVRYLYVTLLISVFTFMPATTITALEDVATSTVSIADVELKDRGFFCSLPLTRRLFLRCRSIVELLTLY
jgi:hypothetical protein